MDRREMMNLIGAGAIGTMAGYYVGAKELLGIQSSDSVTQPPAQSPTKTAPPQSPENTSTGTSSTNLDGFEDGDYTASPEWTRVKESGGMVRVQEDIVARGSLALEIQTAGQSDNETEILENTNLNPDNLTRGDRISWWMRSEDVNAGSGIDYKNPDGGRLNVRLQAGYIKFDGDEPSGAINIAPAKDNTWYKFIMTYAPRSLDLRIETEDGDVVGEVKDRDICTGYEWNRVWLKLQDKNSSPSSAYFDDVCFQINS